MATLTLELASADVDRVVEAFEAYYGARDDQAETKGEFVARHIQLKINNMVRQRAVQQASDEAVAAYVDLNWTDV